MKKTLAFLWIVCLFFSFLSAQKDEAFVRGIVYYLLGDRQLAKENLDGYFRERPAREVSAGYDLLLANKQWEAARMFNKYLENFNRQRVQEALVGVSLSVTDMGTSTTIENLNKALRYNYNYVPAYAGLAFEYLKVRDYPQAELILNKAFKYAPSAETKLLLGHFYLVTAQPKRTLDLVKPEADALPENFHLNLMTAKAALELGQFDVVEQYCARALRVKAQAPEAVLVQAKLLIRQGEYKRARSLLERIQFDSYNTDYTVSMAEALVRMEDSVSERYLYEAFAADKWHPRLNRLFAVFTAKKKRENAQNWIYRALLAGNSREEIQKEVGGGFALPAYPALPFFEAKKICWLDASTLAVAGRQRSGDKEALFVVGVNPLAVIKSFPYQGSAQEMFLSPSGDSLILCTTYVENEKVFLYHLQNVPKRYAFKPVSAAPVPVGVCTGAFSQDGKEFFFTDSGFSALAFESPFSQVGSMGQRLLVYPDFPFRLYDYTLASGSLVPVRELSRLRKVPIPDVQKYLLVADAFLSNQDVESLIRKGQSLELTSSDYVKIHFSDDLKAFIIFYADLKNAFQAIIFHSDQNKAYRADETMFLGKRKYAELDVCKFDAAKREIYIQTKDKDRRLIRFNYTSLLYDDKFSSPLLDFFTLPGSNRYFVLSEKKRYPYTVDSLLEAYTSSSSSSGQKVTPRTDISKILGLGSRSDMVLFATQSGEMLKLQEEKALASAGVFFEGVPLGISRDAKQAAVAINGRVLLVRWEG